MHALCVGFVAGSLSRTAWVDRFVAVLSGPAWSTSTAPAVDRIGTHGVVVARCALAFIDIADAVVSLPACGAVAAVASDIIGTLAVVSARLGSTFINIHVARSTTEPGGTLARKAALQIHTHGAVGTIGSHAVVHVDFTVLTLQTVRAIAAVDSSTINAGCNSRAWIGCTLVDVSLAVCTDKTSHAVAGVRVKAVDALASVLTRRR